MTEHRLAPVFRLISSHLPTYGPGFEGVQVITACYCGEKRPADGYGGWWAWHVAHALDEGASSAAKNRMDDADVFAAVSLGLGNVLGEIASMVGLNPDDGELEPILNRVRKLAEKRA